MFAHLPYFPSAEFGHYALALACTLAVIQGFAPLIGIFLGNKSLIDTAPPLALGQFIALCVSFACLIYASMTNDFSVKNIVENSSIAKPMLYKIAGVWGNHEGSILLWAFILGLCGACVALFGRDLPTLLYTRVIAILGVIACGFILFCLTVSNPFTRIWPVPPDGMGMNPLLQDPGLAFHPPILYAGYVGFAIPFAFAVAALLGNNTDASWGKWVRPWAIGAWCFLTCGIALGSWWSYYVLGWGGYWFWDPVENASLIPWLTGTALIHSCIVVQRRDTLKLWAIFLSLITFCFSLSGTFLVRSGILNSVHAFANDPARGIFILGLLGIICGGAFSLFAWRAPYLQGTGSFTPLSREGSLVYNNVILCSICAVVLTGTMYPPFVSLFFHQTISVGKPFFDVTTIPLALLLFLIMGFAPMIPWKKAEFWPVISRLWGAALMTLIASLVIMKFITGLLPIICGCFAIWIATTSLTSLATRLGVAKSNIRQMIQRIKSLPLSIYGTFLAHLGVAITVLGIVGMSQAQHKIVEIPIGTTEHLGGYDWTLNRVDEYPGPNFNALQARIDVSQNGHLITVMTPRQKHFSNWNQSYSDVAIHSTIFSDLYVVLGDVHFEAGKTFCILKIHHNPLAPWIWLGALFMALGGLLSIIPRLSRHTKIAHQKVHSV